MIRVLDESCNKKRTKQTASKGKAGRYAKDSDKIGARYAKQEETTSKGKTEANDKQEKEKEQEQEKEQDKDKDKEKVQDKDKEQMLYPPISLPSGRDDIPPLPSRTRSSVAQKEGMGAQNPL